MLIACVKTGDKYDERYVLNLQSGILRHLNAAHEFVCFTDKEVDGVQCRQLPADLPGWWAKIGLFKLREPLIYFDLDVIITGDLGPLLDWDGFGIIKDWWRPGFNSSVMKLTGDEGEVWDRFNPKDMARFYMGDQQYISYVMSKARTFPSKWFPSYKANECQTGVPDVALAVVFHGEPKPHEIAHGCVPELWNKTQKEMANV